LPPLDLHAHIDIAAPADDLQRLGAVVFAATRSLAEARAALQRQDELVIWGVGSHPGMVRSHNSFDPAGFRALIGQTAFVSEVGLDGSAKIPRQQQLQTLRGVLNLLVNQPRITSLHSYRATDELLDELAERPVHGAVLHWWLGSAAATTRAVELGCYFSVNAAMLRQPGILRHIQLDRLITETDHPYGDRSGPEPHQPGNVLPVEHAIGRVYGLDPEAIRGIMWRNLARLVQDAGCGHLLSGRISSYLALASSA
jgi:TatD DNase family protein